MTTLAITYHAMPQHADKSVIKPSKAFRKRVYQSVWAIILFIFSYLVLFAVAVGIAVAFGALGIGLLMIKAMWMTGMLALGLVGSGVMLIYFVIKFMFKRTPEDRAGMVEIFEADQPELFAFINKITQETGAASPKHIYLAADVNAGVFYDSNFWSMFFPIKKNLKIGLGLVNSLNVSEFKAVMAHEFGHFSQRSMKFGSYVYNLNKVIYSMLYDNEGYETALNRLSSAHSIFRLFAMLNIWIVKGMQFVLRKVYIVLNRTHMALSREMEFHADAVAAYVSGSNNVITSFKRIDIGQAALDRLFGYWNEQLESKKRSANLYPEQSELIRIYADGTSMDMDEAGLPVIEQDTVVAETTEVVITDQWSSHPSNEDREASVNKLGLECNTNTSPAWVLFRNASSVQQMMTDKLYQDLEKAANAELVDFESFKIDFRRAASPRALDKRYKGYYDDRNISTIDIDRVIKSTPALPAVTFEELFSTVNVTLPKVLSRMQSDIGTLDTVINYRDDIKTFDYRGNRYGRNQAAEVQTHINSELENTKAALQDLDERVFAYFYKLACENGSGADLAERYKTFITAQNEAVADYDMYYEIHAIFNPLYETTPNEKIHEILTGFYTKEEVVKPRMRQVMDSGVLDDFLDDAERKQVEEYLANGYNYFDGTKYDQPAIAAFSAGTGAFIGAVSNRHFAMKKDLLCYQLQFLPQTEPA